MGKPNWKLCLIAMAADALAVNEVPCDAETPGLAAVSLLDLLSADCAFYHAQFPDCLFGRAQS
jgi:hypothetical protein